MEYDRRLAELFSQEDSARAMANRLGQLARTSRAAAAAERESLLAFLRGPLERHFLYEEEAIFAKLEQRGLGAEVTVALKQHAAVRQLADKLEEAAPSDDIGQLVFDISRLLLHHTNFESDYIYPELTHEDWRELLEETIH
ncbi:MAG TPA: hemerythrin domain-containing protein [Minicystis sp.]|nr:hemerythrin domain-containing protein [Minicystis sp.]